MSHTPSLPYHALTDVPGVLVGHWTDPQNATGCTVVLVPKGAVGGVEVRGSAPGTRETDLLRPLALVQQVHGVVLAGGSAFGLAAADGVMRWLGEQGIGFPAGQAIVPIVPAAILFDRNIGNPKAYPGPEEGYRACQEARSGMVEEGSVGAGTGATVGKALGIAHATKGGIGTASMYLGEGVVVAALVAVNAVGDVVDPPTGRILAGPRRKMGDGFLSTVDLILRGEAFPHIAGVRGTTIGVVATNARLTKEQVNKVAVYAQDGLVLAVRPCHTMRDGDCFFALATGECPTGVDVDRVGVAVTRVVAEAVVRAVLKATPLAGIPSARQVLPDLPVL